MGALIVKLSKKNIQVCRALNIMDHFMNLFALHQKTLNYFSLLQKYFFRTLRCSFGSIKEPLSSISLFDKPTKALILLGNEKCHVANYKEKINVDKVLVYE